LEDEYKGKSDVDGGTCVDRGDGGKVECIVQWWRIEMEGGRALRRVVIFPCFEEMEKVCCFPFLCLLWCDLPPFPSLMNRDRALFVIIEMHKCIRYQAYIQRKL
jgi:hypothetical protein